MKMFYKVQIHPSQLVAMYVRHCKQYVHQRVGKFKFITSDPHISLFSFEANVQHEQLLIKALRAAASRVALFDVSLNGFSYFTQSKTLFLKVENANMLKKLNQLFHDAFLETACEMGIELSNMSVTDYPQITIGAGFESKSFVSLYNVFANEKYRQAFTADQAMLFKYMGRGQNKLISRAPFRKGREQIAGQRVGVPQGKSAQGQMELVF